MSVSVDIRVIAEGECRHPGRTARQVEYFAVSRRCRHLRADLADGSIDADGCLVCPWHRSKYDVRTGRMTRGPQGVFAKIPGFDAATIALTKVWPLRRGNVTVDGNELQVD